MSFAQSLSKAVAEGRQSLATPIIDSFKSRCTSAAKVGERHASLKLGNPHRKAWATAYNLDEETEITRLTVAVTSELEALGLLSISVNVRVDTITLEAGWLGRIDGSNADFARSLNALVVARRRENASLRDSFCQTVLDAFKVEAMKQAAAGLSAARHVSVFPAGDFKLATMDDGEVDGRSALLAMVEKAVAELGLENACVELGGNGNGVAVGRFNRSFYAIGISYHSGDSGSNGKKMDASSEASSSSADVALPSPLTDPTERVRAALGKPAKEVSLSPAAPLWARSSAAGGGAPAAQLGDVRLEAADSNSLRTPLLQR